MHKQHVRPVSVGGTAGHRRPVGLPRRSPARGCSPPRPGTARSAWPETAATSSSSTAAPGRRHGGCRSCSPAPRTGGCWSTCAPPAGSRPCRRARSTRPAHPARRRRRPAPRPVPGRPAPQAAGRHARPCGARLDTPARAGEDSPAPGPARHAGPAAPAAAGRGASRRDERRPAGHARPVLRRHPARLQPAQRGLAAQPEPDHQPRHGRGPRPVHRRHRRHRAPAALALRHPAAGRPPRRRPHHRRRPHPRQRRPA